MVLDDTYVYWTMSDYEVLRRAPKEGGGVEAIPLAVGAEPDGIAVDSARVYVGSTDDSALESGPKGGGDVTVLSSNQEPSGMFAVAVDGTHVYWSAHTSDFVRRIPKEGGEIEIVSNQARNATTIALDDTYIYWGVTPNGNDPDQSSIARAPKGGGDTEVIATGLGACPSLAIDDEYVYWVTQIDCRVQRVPKQGGPVQDVSEASPHGRCSAIGIDGSQVFWASAVHTFGAPAAVWHAPKEGGKLALLAWEEGVNGLALDESYVYFPSKGSFRRVAK
jgi:streptogramin lyase